MFARIVRAVTAPLPFADSARLVEVPGRPALDVADPGPEFTAAAAYWRPTLAYFGSVAEVQVTSGFLTVLGIRPTRGRDLIAGHRECLISESYRQTHGTGPVPLAGAEVGTSCPVVGVLPAGFHFPYASDVWEGSPDRAVNGKVTIARLADRVPLQVSEERFNAQPLRTYLLGDQWELLRETSLSGLLFLLLVLAAITNLLWLRCVRRADEVTIRLALGAGQRRITVDFLREVLLQAVVGTVLGLALLGWGRSLEGHFLPAGNLLGSPSWASAVAVSAIIALLCALVCGSAAIAMVRRNRRFVSVRSHVFAGTQAAVCMALLVSVLLMVHSVMRRLSLPPGFRPEGVLAVRLIPPPPPSLVAAVHHGGPGSLAFQKGEALWHTQAKASFAAAQERIAGLPGIEATAAIVPAPFDAVIHPTRVYLANPNAGDNVPYVMGHVAAIGPDALTLLGVPLLEGRTFSASEDSGAAVVSRSLADRFWPGRSALGQTFYARGQTVRVIGVVGDIRENSLDPAQILPTAYLRLTDFTLADLLIRAQARADAAAIAAEVRRVLPMPVGATPPPIAMLSAEQAAPWTHQKMLLGLLTVFATMAGVVAAAGVWAHSAQTAAQRRREIGVRLALGATRGGVVRMMLAAALRPLLWAVPAGCLLAYLAAEAMGHLLYGTSQADPWAYLTATGLLTAVGTAVSLWPGFAAGRTDPAEALRAER
jgi:hypothetical protein